MSILDIFRAKDRAATKSHVIGKATIALNSEHNLPKYQAKHPLYDRFLPILAGVLPKDGSWIIDVGANVGDTAAALAQSTQNPILSIEGDREFSALLVENVRQFGTQVMTVFDLIGTGNLSGSLVQDGTTATRRDGLFSTSTPLDDVLKRHSIDSVSLLKTDTDGFDVDIIMSAPQMLQANHPLIFWENEFHAPDQLTLLDKGYDFLADLGYNHVWVFDNFGFPLLCDVGFPELRQINRYMADMLAMKVTPSFFYVDVLAATPEMREMACQAVDRYRGIIPSL